MVAGLGIHDARDVLGGDLYPAEGSPEPLGDAPGLHIHATRFSHTASSTA
jgi:hypothetical protein